MRTTWLHASTRKRASILSSLIHFVTCETPAGAWTCERQRGAPGKFGGGAQFFLDAQQLVVLGDPVGARRRAGFDLAGAHGDHEVGDERVFCFAGAVGND